MEPKMRRPALTCTAMMIMFLQAASASPEDSSLAPPVNQQESRIKIGQDKPWQTEDGIIHHQGRTYESWRSYFDARSAAGTFDQRCGVPELDVDDWREIEGFMPPSDCSNSNTNPAEEYDPSNGLFRIPCVVHVIRDSAGNLGDIPESRVISGIRILNEDFQALAGTNGSNGTDCQVEFYLAEFDPDGQPTNGITFSNNTTWYNDGGNYYNTLAWDPNKYLNIYTNTASGNLGYVPFLPANGSVGSLSDRVVVLWESYGEGAPIGPPYNLGRTLTHEVGHYLGLNHTFNGGCDSGSCSNSGDLICDTSPQNSATFGCNGSSCSGVVPDDNYMDYSDDQCMEKFTPDQSRRMRCTILNWRPEIAEEGVNYISLSQFGTVPDFVSPTGTTLRVQINENEENGYRTGSGQLHYSTGGGFTSITLEDEGLAVYAASVSDLPCGESLSWYFTAEDVEQNVRRLPSGSGTFSSKIAEGFEITFSDDSETDLGYGVSGSATDGPWQIGIPIDCSRGDPNSDGDGSGRAWLTDNSSAASCNSDVDGGATTLTTPIINALGGEAFISYYCWYDNTGAGQGASPGADVFLAEISNDGGSNWSTLETVGPSDSRSSGGWNLVSFRVADYVSPTEQIRVRFTAEDAGEGSVIEAGIDGLRIEIVLCDEVPACLGDINGDRVVNGSDLSSLLGFWGQTDVVQDLSGDNRVDGTDLSILLGFWGDCPE
jgi:hypothetical protein